MKRSLTPIICSLGASLLALPTGGCFFVYVPGTVIDSASDAFTGEHGKFCVSPAQKIGDQIRLPGGTQGTLTSLSGPSKRCHNPGRPIRAEIL